MLEGEWRNLEDEPQEGNFREYTPFGDRVRRIGQSLGRGAYKIGTGTYRVASNIGKGIQEGIEEKRLQDFVGESYREYYGYPIRQTGRGLGRNLYKAFDSTTRPGFASPEELWGKNWSKPSNFSGSTSRRPGASPTKSTSSSWGIWKDSERPVPIKEKKPRSGLPLESQVIILDELYHSHPTVFQSIWYQGITYSEMVGTLRDLFPAIYGEIRETRGV